MVANRRAVLSFLIRAMLLYVINPKTPIVILLRGYPNVVKASFLVKLFIHENLPCIEYSIGQWSYYLQYLPRPQQ